MNKTFYPARLSGTTAAPASKSEAHRRMICAGLARGTTELTGFMDSDDMGATRRCLRALGARITQEGDRLTIVGGARKPELLPILDCGESGSTLRFFVPIAMAVSGGGIFRMHGRLGARPMDVYRDLFVPAGVQWRMGAGADGAAELFVHGRLNPGHYELPGNVSSQFVSGLMFALPLLPEESLLTVTPPVESVGYIQMTLEALRSSGIEIEKIGSWQWRIPGAQRYQPVSGALQGDYSQAAVLLCAAALGHSITVTSLAQQTAQGDRSILKHLTALGAQVVETPEGVTVKADKRHGAVLDMADTPDIAPMLALVCQLSEGESRLCRCGRLRQKESDRLTETVNMLRLLGGNIRVEGDDMVIRGVQKLRGGATVNGCNDHRMIMLASIAASVAELPVTVTDVEALHKSWPDYLNVYADLGGKAE